jgi:hypothetical protein
VREERYRKRVGWAMAGVHGVLGATCLYRGLKEGECPALTEMGFPVLLE